MARGLLPDDNAISVSTVDGSNVKKKCHPVLMGIIEELVDEPPEDQLHQGATVRVDRLKAAPEHNGVEGELLKFDQDAGRWQVLLATGPAVKVKPANLIFVRPKPAFRFAPRRRSGSDDEISVDAIQIHKSQCHSMVTLRYHRTLTFQKF